MIQVTLELTEQEHKLLTELAIPDKEGKLAVISTQRDDQSFVCLEGLSLKGLVNRHFITSWDRCECLLSSAGCFLMNWKGEYR